MKTLLEKIFLSVLGVILSVSMFSCSDDESSDPYDVNYTYVYPPINADHTLLYYADGNFVKSVNEEETLVPVRCTRPAPSNVEVVFSIDESLIESYNEAHETDYVLLEKVELINSRLIIPKGKYESKDTLKVKYTDVLEFRNGSKHYILPIVISKLSGGTILSEKRVIYLTYESNVILMEESSSPTGRLIEERSGWSVTMNGKDKDDNGELVNNIIKDNNNNLLYTESTPAEFVFNLGKKEQISDIAFNFYAYFYAPAEVAIALSEDGVTYEDLGSTTLSMASSNIITLFKKKSSQYVKVTFSGYQYYGAYIIQEIKMYTSE